MKPRVRIFNHRVTRDAPEQPSGEEGTTLPWSKRQAFNEALKHLKRAVSAVPDSVVTSGEAKAAGRALGHAKQELVVALRLISESE